MWKGHILRPSSTLCRPTSSLLRSAFLDIAGRDLILSARIWDLCAGTGAVGLETLSWGASSCVFVDLNPKSTALIRKFLNEHDASARAKVITADIKDYIRRADTAADVVYVDPPYRMLRLYEWLDTLDWSSIVAPDGAVFVECGSRNSLSDSWIKRAYGDSYLCWKLMRDLQ